MSFNLPMLTLRLLVANQKRASEGHQTIETGVAYHSTHQNILPHASHFMGRKSGRTQRDERHEVNFFASSD